MKRKIKTSTIVLSTFAGFAMILSGCGNVWTGGNLTPTEYSFDGTEGISSASLGTSSSMHETARHAIFKIDNNSFDSGAGASRLHTFTKAAEDTELTLEIQSYARLDEDSVAKAVKFYALTGNPIYASGAPKRSESPLPSSIVDYTSIESTGNAASSNVKTLVDIQINTTSVTTDAIAIFIDAAILKDINGNFVVNANQNEICGEESDSLVRYIGIGSKSDGETPDALSFSYGEDFSPDLVYAPALNVSVVSNGNGTFTVVSGSAEYADYTATPSPTEKQKTDLNTSLDKLWSIQIREDGASAWVQGSLTFHYESDTKKYESQELTLTPGTKYRLVKNIPASGEGLSEITQSNILYGHEAKQSYTKAYTEYKSSQVATYFSSEPSYIISSASFAQGEYSQESIEDAQKDLLSVTEKDNGKFDVQLLTLGGEQLEFDSYSDFILTDEAMNKITCSVILKNKTTATVIAESFYEENINLWIGNGTSIKSNPNNNQKKFGLFKDSDYGVASGYVKIN